MKSKGDDTGSDKSSGKKKKGKKVDDTGSDKSQKKRKVDDTGSDKSSRKKTKGKKVDDTGSDKSQKKRKVDDTGSDKSSRKKKKKGKKVDDTGSDKSEKKNKGERESEWVHLDHLPVPIIWGRRSKKDAEDKSWYCKCGTTNHASRHLFIDLPSFRCSNENCRRRPKHVDFRFSYGNLRANGVCPIGEEIYNQKNKSDCFLFAIAKGCQAAANIRNTVLGNGKRVRPMNPYSFKKHLEMLNGGVELAVIETGSPKSEQRVRHLLATEGITELGGQNVYRFKTLDFDRLPDDVTDLDQAFAIANQAFEALATALADGSPVMTSITLGRKFKDLEYGKVYKMPANPQYADVTDSDDEDDGGEKGEKKTKQVQITHSVLLVGAARKGTMDYYYFLNSHGVKFCVRVDNETGKKACGIGKISAEDAYTGLPFKILTFG